MKILFIVHDYWPNFNAGVENHTHYLAQALSKNHDVFIFTTEPNSSDEKHEIYFEDSVKIIKIHTKDDKPVNPRETYINDKLDQIFAEYIDEIKPDVIHIQHLIRLSLSFIDIINERNIPLVYTLHDLWFECPYFRKYKNKRNCDVTSKNIDDCNNCLEVMIPPKKNVETVKPIGLKAKLRKYPLVFNFFKAIRNTPFLKDLFWVLLKKISEIRSGQFLKKSSPEKSLIEIRKDVFKDYYQKVDLFITPSAFLAKEAIDFGLSKEKVMIIRHGIPTLSKNTKISKKTYNKKSKINFGFASHITEDKGFFLLIHNFEKLLKEYSNIQLSIYGSYDKNDKLIKKTLATLKKPIVYGGVYDSRDTDKIFSKLDVLIVPSLWNEIYGLVVDEAFLNNIPVIVSNKGAMLERVTDGKNGFIFNPNKRNDLYERMKTISDNPVILNRLKGSIPKVKSMERYSTELEKVYKGILDKR